MLYLNDMRQVSWYGSADWYYEIVDDETGLVVDNGTYHTREEAEEYVSSVLAEAGVRG